MNREQLRQRVEEAVEAYLEAAISAPGRVTEQPSARIGSPELDPARGLLSSGALRRKQAG